VCDLQDWSCLNELELNFYTECEGSHCFSIALINESRSGIFQHVILQATKFFATSVTKRIVVTIPQYFVFGFKISYHVILSIGL